MREPIVLNWARWNLLVAITWLLISQSAALAQLTVRSDHPRIWIMSDNLQEIRARNLNGSMQSYWQTFRSRNVDGQKVDANNVADFALTYLITGDIQFANQVVSFLKTGNLGGARIEWNLVAFDWVYNAMSDSDRQTIRQRLTGGWKASDYPDDPQDCVPLGPDATFVNWGWHHTQFKGIVFDGDDAVAPKDLGCAEAEWGDALKVMDNIFPDGEWWEGFEYARQTLPYAVFQMSAIKSATGTDRFQDSEPFRGFREFVMYGTRPDGTYSRLDDIWAVNGADRIFRDMLLQLNSQYKDPHIQWYLNNWLSIHPNDTDVFDILYFDPSAPQQPPDDMPLAKHFQGWGTVYMRTGWTKGSYNAPPNDTFIEFKCGDFYSYHNQYASNTFNIYHKGALLSESLGYPEPGPANRTVVHNTVLVYDPNEVWPLAPGTTQPAENDGGQRIVQWEVNRPKTYDQWVNNPGKWESGNIEHFETNTNYTYVKGNATPAYNSSKLSNFTRQLTFMHPDYVVVYDRVSSTDPSFQKTWVIHSLKAPLISPGENDIVPPAGINTYDSHTLRIDRGDGLAGRLYVKTIIPQSSQVEVVGGPGYEIWFAGRNHSRTKRNALEEQADWRIGVQPKIASKEDIFLNVLYITDTSVNSMPPSQRLNSISGDQMYGVHVQDQGNNSVVMFSAEEAVVTKSAYSVSDVTTVKHLICDVTPNRDYFVTRNGVTITSGLTNEAGTVYFEDNPNGTAQYEINVLDTATPVKLSSFTATVVDNSVLLVWVTATATNNFEFEVQRSRDSQHFQKVGFVSGDEEANHYQFKDENVEEGDYYYRLKQIDFGGSFTYSGSVEVTLGLPTRFTLQQNSPNPFNPDTKVRYTLPEKSHIQFVIFNLRGQKVRTLVDEEQSPGFKEIIWNGKDDNGKNVPSGLYIYALLAGSFRASKKMLLLR